MVKNSGSDAGGMSPLARRLIAAQDNGLSFREMERKALGAGLRYSSSAFEQVAKDNRAGRLDIDAIKAIAVALDESVELIARLDDERWGIKHDPAAMPVGLGLDAEAEGLAPEQVEAVRTIIKGMKQ